MAQEAELRINSSSVERTTVAVDALYKSLLNLEKGSEGAEAATDHLTTSQKRQETALRNSEAASRKAIDLLQLEQKGLDKTSQEYAELKGAILAKDAATKKGISISSKEYKSLKANIIAKEKATVETRRLALEQRKLSNATKQGSQDFSKFTNSLDRATKHVQLIDGPLGGIASRMTAFSSIVKGGALPVAALALSTGLLVKSLWSGANVADANVVSMKGLEAQLIATNHAAGFSADGLDTFARSLAFETLDNTEGVKELIGVMLGFDKVSGDAFTRSITLSQDLGIAMKQSPITAAKTLGKVLQNPIKNYLQLKRSGIEFSEVEKENLKLAQKNNDLRTQQEIILKKVEDKFKGIAKAQTDSLAGDKDTLGQNWQELWELLGGKLIPVFRAVTQAANWAAVAVREVFETDAETSFREWAISGGYLNESLDEITDSLDTLESKLQTAISAQKESSKELSKQVVYGIDYARQVRDTAKVKQADIDLIKLQIESYKKLKDAKIESNKKDTDQATEKVTKALEKSNLELKKQQTLTEEFLKTGDTRSKQYRQAKVAIDAEVLATKLNLDINSKQFVVLKSNLQVISDLTEQRVKHNTAIQKEKGLLSKQRGLEKEIALYKLNREGILSTSTAYLQESARIDARNQALSAGFEIGSKEHKNLEKQTLALAKLQEQAGKMSDLSTAGFQIDDIGRALIVGTEKALNYADAQKKRSIMDLFISDEITVDEKDAALEKLASDINERVRSSIAPLGFTIDEEGNTVLLESLEGLAVERHLKLKELEDAYKENKFNDDVAYAERYAEVERQFDEKAIKRKEELFEKTAAHRKRMQQAEVAGTIASGIENLAAVSGNNKKLAKAAKLMSMFQASTSLVDALAKAYALGYPAGIPAAAAAFSQGTQLIGMASSLNEPSFANGGVDIRGSGTGRSDSIRANIANGESVMTATATTRHKDTLRRMNAGLSTQGGAGTSITAPLSITIMGDASEKTVSLIESKLLSFETRVEQISQGVSLQTIQSEQEVGGLFNEI